MQHKPKVVVSSFNSKKYITQMLCTPPPPPPPPGGASLMQAPCLSSTQPLTAPCPPLTVCLPQNDMAVRYDGMMYGCGCESRHARCGAVDQEAGEAQGQPLRPLPAVQGQQQTAPDPECPAGPSRAPCSPPQNQVSLPPVLSCPVLSCPVLSCPVLSCPVLSKGRADCQNQSSSLLHLAV